MILGVRGHPPRRKTMIFIGGLFKIEGRPFRARASPGSILGGKMEQKWRPGAYKIKEKSMQKSIRKLIDFFIDFGTHFGAKNEAKVGKIINKIGPAIELISATISEGGGRTPGREATPPVRHYPWFGGYRGDYRGEPIKHLADYRHTLAEQLAPKGIHTAGCPPQGGAGGLIMA